MHLLISVLLFLTVICLTTLCGLGLLHLCGQRDFKQRILLAPSMALAATGIGVAIIVILGIPVGTVSPLIWFLWTVFAIYGSIHIRSAIIDLAHRHILWISVLATMLALGGFLFYGVSDYLGSPALDGWSYASFGEYLLKYKKGTEGGLAPVYQYASHLSGTRYIASAILAALIPPWSVGVDTQMTVGPLLILSVFSFALAMAYAAQINSQRGLDTPMSVAVILGVLGWIPHALHANNYDNLLALPLAPILFALAADRNLNKSGQIFLPAIFIAASIYIYPELSILIILAYGVVAIEDLFLYWPEYKAERNWQGQFLKYIGIIVIAGALASPYLRDAIRFFGQQLSTTARVTGRPGEGMMPALLDGTLVWGAMWGLGSRGWGVVTGVLLGQIALLGAITAISKRNFAIILYLLLFSTLFVVMVVLKHYDYGAYKILLLEWWAVAMVLTAGFQRIFKTTSTSDAAVNYYLKIGTGLILASAVSLWLELQYIRTMEYKYRSATDIRAVRDVVKENQGAVAISISDPYLNAWLVYQLRDARALFTEFQGYMGQPHVRPLMERSKVPDQGEIKYTLTDVQTLTSGDLVWKNDSFKLVKGMPDQQLRININAPNGREILRGLPFFWLGREPASIVLQTVKTMTVRIDFQATVGPSVKAPLKDYPKIIIEGIGIPMLEFETKSTEIQTVHVTLRPGSNTLIFQNDYGGNIIPNGNGDPRILLVGIALNRVTIDD